MPVIAFAAGLVAILCVSDVNAVVLETCLYTDAECTAVIAGSCLAGNEQEGGYYDNRQDPEIDSNYAAMSEYTTCTAFAEAQYDKYTEYYTDNDGGTDRDYDNADEMVAGLNQCTLPMSGRDDEWGGVHETIDGDVAWWECTSCNFTSTRCKDSEPVDEKKIALQTLLSVANAEYKRANCGTSLEKRKENGGTL